MNGEEVGHGGVRVRLEHREGERGGNDHDQADPEPYPKRGLAPEHRQGHEEGWVDQVELLFDGQRPEIEQGGGRLILVEVVRPDRGEVKVGQEHRRPAAVDSRRVPVDGPQDPVRGDDAHHDHERRGGDDAAAAAPVEAEERGPTAACAFSKQEPSDDESRYHEEDIHTDIAAAQRVQPTVVENHQHDGDCPKSLDIGTEAAVTGSRPRFITEDGQLVIDRVDRNPRHYAPGSIVGQETIPLARQRDSALSDYAEAFTLLWPTRLQQPDKPFVEVNYGWFGFVGQMPLDAPFPSRFDFCRFMILRVRPCPQGAEVTHRPGSED